MAWPGDDCECVQGIEYFIDPRLYLPTYEAEDPNVLELPVWERQYYKGSMEYQASSKTVSKSSTNNTELINPLENAGEGSVISGRENASIISPERVIKLVVQRDQLINQNYLHLVAHKVNSTYIQLDSLDSAWRKANVSLIFNHENLNESVTVPVIELGKPTVIPAKVLIPGTLIVSAIAMNKLGDYSVITAEGLKLQVYDSKVGRVTWPEMKSYDVYYHFQSMVASLIQDFKEQKDATPIKTETSCILTVKDLTNKTSEAHDLGIVIHSTKEYAKVSFDKIELKLDPTVEYELEMTLPLENLGIVISKDEYAAVADKLSTGRFVINANNLTLSQRLQAAVNSSNSSGSSSSSSSDKDKPNCRPGHTMLYGKLCPFLVNYVRPYFLPLRGNKRKWAEEELRKLLEEKYKEEAELAKPKPDKPNTGTNKDDVTTDQIKEWLESINFAMPWGDPDVFPGIDISKEEIKNVDEILSFNEINEILDKLDSGTLDPVEGMYGAHHSVFPERGVPGFVIQSAINDADLADPDPLVDDGIYTKEEINDLVWKVFGPPDHHHHHPGPKPPQGGCTCDCECGKDDPSGDPSTPDEPPVKDSEYCDCNCPNKDYNDDGTIKDEDEGDNTDKPGCSCGGHGHKPPKPPFDGICGDAMEVPHSHPPFWPPFHHHKPMKPPTGDKDGIYTEFDLGSIIVDYTCLPSIKIYIPAKATIETLKLAIQELTFKRQA